MTRRWLIGAIGLTLVAGCGYPTEPALAVPDTTPVVDDAGAVWTIGTSHEVLRDGTLVISPDFGGNQWKGYAIRLMLVDHQVYALAYDLTGWWVWGGVRFTPAPQIVNVVVVK